MHVRCRQYVQCLHREHRTERCFYRHGNDEKDLYARTHIELKIIHTSHRKQNTKKKENGNMLSWSSSPFIRHIASGVRAALPHTHAFTFFHIRLVSFFLRFSCYCHFFFFFCHSNKHHCRKFFPISSAFSYTYLLFVRICHLRTFLHPPSSWSMSCRFVRCTQTSVSC